MKRHISLIFEHCISIFFAVFLLAMTLSAQQPQPLPSPNACSQTSNAAPPCKDSDGDGLCDVWELAKHAPGGVPLPDADPDRPDIYVHYDYMGWAAPGNACTVDADCKEGGAQPNLVCHENRCNHNHRPDPQALQIVVNAFARHGVALHVDADPQEVPHSEVITFARATDDNNGGKAICAGADLQAGVLGGYAVSLFDVKERFFDARRRSTYHYAVFAHLNTCTGSNCDQCPTDRSTPAGLPLPGTSGVAELPGNDFIISLAQSFNNPIASVPKNPYTEAGVFMHELGHNLGLHHAGDAAEPDSAPNYLSVMNNRYVLNGILQVEVPGSTNVKRCLADADCVEGAVCRVVPVIGGRCVRIDYSSSLLNTLNEATLDEAAGVSAADSGLQDLMLYTDANDVNRRGATVGPVDWNGNGIIDFIPVAVDLNAIKGPTEVMAGYNDWDHGSCRTSADCPVNRTREFYKIFFDASVDAHEPCVQNRCQTLWYPSQCTQWGARD